MYVPYKFNIVPDISAQKEDTVHQRGRERREGEMRKERGRKETNEISISLICWSPQGLSTIVICDVTCCVLQSVEVSLPTG